MLSSDSGKACEQEEKGGREEREGVHREVLRCRGGGVVQIGVQMSVWSRRPSFCGSRGRRIEESDREEREEGGRCRC